jgi:hypothetical protein
MLLAELKDATPWLVTAASVFAGILLLRATRYYARRNREPSPSLSPPSLSSPPSSHDMRHTDQDLRSAGDQPVNRDRWEVHMHDTARDLSGQLDSKISALQALVAEADRAAARLEAALAQPDEPVRRTNQQARSLQSEGDAQRDATAAAGAAPRGRHQEEIYMLSDYGYEPAEIARRVNMPIGEIELILSLRGRG